MPNKLQANNYYSDKKIHLVTYELVVCLFKNSNISAIKLDNKFSYNFKVISTKYVCKKVIKSSIKENSHINLKLFRC